MSIEDRSLRSLEWERLLVYLAEQAESPSGQNLAYELRPQTGRELVLMLLDETDEALTLLKNNQNFQLVGLTDISATLSRLGAGSTLSAGELHSVKEVLKISNRVKSSLALMERDHFPRLTIFQDRLLSLKKEVTVIEDAIEAGAVKDTASPQLSKLRRERARLDGAVKEELGRLIHVHSGGKVLQEPLYTMRNGRFVLPVVASMLYAIGGIVHDASQSGLTIYVEPLSVMELSNKARIKESEIEREIERILIELSDLIRPHASTLAEAYDALAELDLIFAKARLATKYDGVKPILSEDHSFNLIAARHPLLALQNSKKVSSGNVKTVVPSDVGLFGSAYTLVITGPNTGGKTVLLKLIGLTALMVRAGLLVPAKSGSTVALFDLVCADIGDEQSLEQSLSTFSAHMQNVVEIVQNADIEGKQMLVLLDEVGAGTDPVEGAALARAILEYLKEKRAVTIATTHLGELKTIAFMDEGFVNGSFEFDDATLSPTYRLRLGVPGSSKASTIAARLGLKQELVDRAKSLIDVNATELEEVVVRLDKRMNDLQAEKDHYQSERNRLTEWEDFLSAREGELAGEREKIRLQYASELDNKFKATEQQLKEMIASLQREPQMAKAQKAKDQLETIKKDLGWLQGRESNKTPKETASTAHLQVGNSVLLRSFNKVGSVQEVIKTATGEISQVVVNMGSMKIKVAPSEVEAVSGKVKRTMLYEERAKRLRGDGSEGRDQGSNKDLASRGGGKGGVRQGQGHINDKGREERPEERYLYVRTQSNTLDLRGKRVEEALLLLEQFVDSCALARVTPFMVIHGHGTGAVKSAVRDYLSTMGYQGEFRPGETYEGGDGVTVVDLTG